MRDYRVKRRPFVAVGLFFRCFWSPPVHLPSAPGGRDKQRRYQARPNAGLAVLHSQKQDWAEV